jgi:hypothetical protein
MFSPVSSSSSVVGQPAASNYVPRVLLFGDSGVGKSILLCQLCSLINEGKASVPRDRIEPTVGYRVEAVGLKQDSAGTPGSSTTRITTQCVELIEIGGNRSLVMGPSSRYQPVVGGGGGAVDAAIFMYDDHKPASAISVATWYRECNDAGIVQGCKHIALIGMSTNVTPITSGFVSATSTTPSPLSSGPSNSLTFSSVIAALYGDPHYAGFLLASPQRTAQCSLPLRTILRAAQLVLLMEHIFLYLCSCLLFGFGQHHVDFQPLSVKQALDVVKRDPKCSSVIEGLPLDDPATFSDNVEELLHFLSHL